MALPIRNIPHSRRRPRVSVLTVGLSYGARNILSYTRHMMQNFLPFRDSPIIPLRRSPIVVVSRSVGRSLAAAASHSAAASQFDRKSANLMQLSFLRPPLHYHYHCTGPRPLRRLLDFSPSAAASAIFGEAMVRPRRSDGGILGSVHRSCKCVTVRG